MKVRQIKEPGFYWGTNPDKTDTTIFKMEFIGGDMNRLFLESFYGHQGSPDSGVWDGWTFSGPLGMPAIAGGSDGTAKNDSLAAIMEANAWRSALLGLCVAVRMTDVATPDKAAENVRARLKKAELPANACHCATCTCKPGMTPSVRFDLSPAATEEAIRDELVRMGWTPPRADRSIRTTLEKSVDALLDEARVTADLIELPVPSNVYWNPAHDNFYDMENSNGMGQEFFEIWYTRRAEFPREPR